MVYASVGERHNIILPESCISIHHTGRTSNNALPPLVGSQMGHLVIRASHLETKHGLQVLSLEKHPAFQPIAQVCRNGDRRLVDDFVHAGGKDEAQVLRKRSEKRGAACRDLRMISEGGFGPRNHHDNGSDGTSG